MLASVAAEPCPDCGGRGWRVEPDGGAGRARRCDCQLRDQAARLLAAAGIPPRYQHCRLTNFTTSGKDRDVQTQLTRAKSVAQRYVDEFLQEGGGFLESGLVFFGAPGVGKTHLAVAVLRSLIERYHLRGRFVEMTALLLQIQATFDPGNPETKSQILDPLLEADLLVLDELGGQQTTPWVRDILYLLINGRYTQRRPTIFTSNLRLDRDLRGDVPGDEGAPAQRRPAPEKLDRGRDPEPQPILAESLLSHRLPPMLISRLFEMAQVVPMEGVGDFRREVKSHGARRI